MENENKLIRRAQCGVDIHEPSSNKKFITSNIIESTCKHCGKIIVATLSNYIWTANI